MDADHLHIPPAGFSRLRVLVLQEESLVFLKDLQGVGLLPAVELGISSGDEDCNHAVPIRCSQQRRVVRYLESDILLPDRVDNL